jgi:predicted flap endonuclease-1-like 5' DNA nuclease
MTRHTESTHPNSAAFPVGMSGPALRALHVAGVRTMDDLTRWTEAELLALHGMGPKGVRFLRDALAASGRQFRRS